MTYGLENRCSIQLSYGCVSLYGGPKIELLCNTNKCFFKFMQIQGEEFFVQDVPQRTLKQDLTHNHLKDKGLS